MLESFTFYLLDDHTDEALQEACRLLPEISSPTTHPKVAQVLLERQNPDAAFMVLRWSGRDGGAELVSLSEAVTAVRVRVECGLLTEAFMYQRNLCSKLKKKKLRHESLWNASDLLKDESHTWMNWMEALVTEICCLCIRRKLVDRIIELPWDSDEEKHLHKCLFDFAVNDALTTTGSLLVVYYLQRYRYIEAYQVDRKLQSLEQDFENSVSEEVLSKMRLSSQWRAGFVDKSIQLLPEFQQQQVKTGKLRELIPPDNEVGAPAMSDLPKAQNPILTSLLVPSSVDSSLVFRAENAIPSLKSSYTETPSKLVGSVNSHFDFSKYGSILNSQASLFDDAERVPKSLNAITKNFKSDDMASPATRRVSSMIATPLQEFNRSSSRNPRNSHLRDDQLRRVSLEKGNNFTTQFQNTCPYKDSAQDSYLNVSSKYVPSERPDKNWARAPSGDLMDMSWSHEEKHSPVEDASANGGPRWRSDDTSEDEEQQGPFPFPNGLTGVAVYNTPMRRTRRSRFSNK